VPDSVTQRYERLVRKLGIHTTIHKLRHYSATELIAAGVDVRTVAGRLGHSGGGVTTLKTYAAWVSEADQRAVGGISSRMPARPAVLAPLERARLDPRSPYEVVAVDLAGQISSGVLAVGDLVPTAEDLAVRYTVAVSTARRAVALLVQWEPVLRVGNGRA
jgi:integrase